MSTSFSANQYDDAFLPNKLANWQRPKLFDERPRALQGSTTIISNDRGHLRPEFRRSKTDPWGTFIGTWNLPKRLPGNRIDVPTGRTEQANDKLRNNWEQTRMRLTDQPWGTINNTIYKQGTRSLASTWSVGCRTGRDSASGPPRKLTPIERKTSAGGKESPALAAADAELNDSSSVHSNKIPLPQLDKPVYVEDRPHDPQNPQDDEAALCAV